jgi:hypothetical protein
MLYWFPNQRSELELSSEKKGGKGEKGKGRRTEGKKDGS